MAQLAGRDCSTPCLFYQHVARHFGYRLHKVRNLTGLRSGDYCSGELLHVGGVSHYKDWKGKDWEKSTGFWNSEKGIIARMDFLLLSELVDRLPLQYRTMRAEFGKVIESQLGSDPDRMRKDVRDFASNNGAPAHVFSLSGMSFLQDRGPDASAAASGDA